MTLQVVGIGTLDGGVIDRGTVVGWCHERSGVKALVVGIPQAQLLHHLLALIAVVGQIGLAVLCQHALVTGTVLPDLIARGLVADDAVLVGCPHTAVFVIVEH